MDTKITRANDLKGFHQLGSYVHCWSHKWWQDPGGIKKKMDCEKGSVRARWLR